MTMRRRTFLGTCLAGLGLATLPRFARAAASSPRFVYVFLRGGADALSLVSPRGAMWTRLQAFRPHTAIAGGQPLSGSLQVHPAMAPLLASDIVGSFRAIPHVGCMADSRSHFDQQYRIETGSIGTSATDGFLKRSASRLAVKAAAVDRTAPSSLLGARPLVIEDPARVQPGYSVGKLDPRWTRAQRLAMYRGTAAEVGAAAIDTAASQAQADGNVLDGELANVSLASLTSAHGYTSSVFGGRLALAAKRMTSSLDPRLLTVDGDQFWDSHVAQLTNDATAWTSLSKSIADLATNLAAFKRDLTARSLYDNVVVVVMSEFGRTVLENAGRGTDHGRGGVMLMLGGRVRGQADTAFTGTTSWDIPADPDDGTPLDVAHDYRVILTEILHRHLAMPLADARAVFLDQVPTTTPFLNVLR